jgi:hypothetical protein
MSSLEEAYLAMVIVAGLAFIAVLFWASWKE